jgi:hypothetical protein
MRLMALDIAVRLGFAIGEAGKVPRSGSIRLKSPEDDPSRACRKLGIWLRDEFTLQIPDLVIIEAPVNIGAFIDWKDDGSKPTFRSNPQTISLLHRLVGGVETLCGPYGVRCVSANVQTVRKHLLGVARPSEPKKAVIARCQMLGLMPKTSKDDNQADAIALHQFAGAHHARAIPSQLILHGETPAPETIESVFGGRAP